jgi:uncharacterized RDD family membrane protein YckC
MQEGTTCGMCGCPLIGESASTLLYDVPVHGSCSRSFNGRRLQAFVFDYALAVVLMLWLFFDYDTTPQARASESAFFFPPMMLLVGAVCLLMKDSFYGTSLGKLLSGLQVVDADTGIPIGLRQSLQRNLLLLSAIGWALPLHVGFGIMPVSLWFVAHRMRFGPRKGDGWANTRVIDRKRRHAPVFARSEIERRRSLAA